MLFNSHLFIFFFLPVVLAGYFYTARVGKFAPAPHSNESGGEFCHVGPSPR
jgi:hypothetical protein